MAYPMIPPRLSDDDLIEHFNLRVDDFKLLKRIRAT